MAHGYTSLDDQALGGLLTSTGLFAAIAPSTYVRPLIFIGSKKVGAAPVARPAFQSSQLLLSGLPSRG